SHLAAEQRRMRFARVASIAEAEATGALHPVCVLSRLFVTGRNDEAILVVGDREIAVHLLHLGKAQPNLLKHRHAVALAELALPIMGAHGQETLQCRYDRRLGAGRQQVGEIADRNAQRLDVGDFSDRLDGPGIGVRLDRRQGRHIPDHRQRAVFRMKWEGDLPVDSHLVDRRAPRRFDPVVGDAVGGGLPGNLRIVGVEEQLELRLIEILLILYGGSCLDAVGVVEKHAEIADPAHAGLGAHGRLAGLDAWIAEDALLGLPRGPVVVDLLVWAPRDAHAPAAALILIDEDNAVLLALVDRAGRTGRYAGRIQAVLAQPGQVHHEGVFELPVDVLLHGLEIVVLRALGEFAA